MKLLKRMLTVGMLAGLSIGLAACSTSSKSKVTTLSSGGSGNYRTVVVNGKYRTSKSRGVNSSNGNSTASLKSFDSGLTTVAKRIFSTKTYIFQEGQYLSSTTINHWLARVSSNAAGLNPKKGSSDDPNPEYIQQIEEQDYMTQDGNNLKLRGMVIGIAVNSEYQYQKETDGPYYTKTISKAEGLAKGKEAAAKILKRLRKNSKLKNIPIVIAIYRQASSDSLVGGNYVAYSRNNGSTISEWHKLNYSTKILPKSSDATSTTEDDQSDDSNFTNFKNKVQNFFPNISGVTAQAQYYNGELSGMNISVTTQFYSSSEIQSFTQYIERQAKKYLPSGIPIEIKIQTSDNEIQSVVYRNSNSDDYESHVFSTY